MDQEGREINYLTHYLGLTAMYFLQGQPSDLLCNYADYEKVHGLDIPRYRDACIQVQDIVRSAASQNLTGSYGLLYLAAQLQERNTEGTGAALFYLEHALCARIIINSRPHILETRTEAELEATKTALEGIVALRRRRAA